MIHEKELERAKKIEFRVSCLYPLLIGDGAPLISGYAVINGKRENTVNINLCTYGHAMSIMEMNKNLIKKGSPFIQIPYCNNCFNKESIGVFDERNDAIRDIYGFHIRRPNETEDGYFDIEIVNKNKFINYLEKRDKNE